MRAKQFWVYNNEDDARAVWGDWLDEGTRTTKTIAVVDDATRWLQTNSKTTTITKVELPGDVIAF